jgi:hypothetical protein
MSLKHPNWINITHFQINLRKIGRSKSFMAFIISLVALLIFHFYKNITYYWWDSGAYYNMGVILLDSGITPASYGIRGYFLAACLSLCVLTGRLLDALFSFNGISGGYIAFRIISSIGYAGFFACLLPRLYLRFFGGHDGLLRRLLPLALTIAFWPGLLLYPVSDVCAVAFFYVFLWSLTAWYDSDHLWRGAVRMLLAGAAGYACYNTRLVYQYPIMVSMIFPLIVWIRGFLDPRKSTLGWLRRTVLHNIAFALGFLLIAAPQMYANRINFNIWSPSVVGFRISRGESLEQALLRLGMSFQNYFNNTDSNSSFGHVGGISAVDRAGNWLATEWGDTYGYEMKGFLRLVFSKPFDFIGLYGRHLVHNMDIFDGKIYYSYPFRYQYLRTFLGFTVFFIAAFVLAMATPAPSLRREFFWHPRLRWCLLFLPALQIIPLTVEPRYFFSVHLSLFCGLAYLFDLQHHLKILRKRWFVTAILYLVLIAVFMGVSTTAFAYLMPR